MTIIVEDGSKVSNSNSYVSAADFIVYCAARGYTIDPLEAEQWIVMSMDYLETLQYIGVKSSRDQSLSWPRYDVVIDTWNMDPNTIPKELVKAQNEIALQMSLGNDPLQNREPTLKSEQVGSIRVEYADGASMITLPVKITSFLSKITYGGLGFRVSRA